MKMIFLGAPGVGKGTYASRIGPKMDIPHISTGDLLRAELKEGSELGKKAKGHMESGGLVPDGLVIEMIKQRLEQPDAQEGFILDGYPRTTEQAQALEGITGIDVVVNILLKDEVVIKKIAARRVCRDCGNIYNLAHIKEEGLDMPPLLPKVEGVCDKCSGKLYQRKDDEEEVVRERLDVYKKQTAPLIEFYRNKGILVDVRVVGGPDIMVPKIIEAVSRE